MSKRKLSDAQLMRLSQIVNERPQHGHGVALDALERKGYVEPIPELENAFPRSHRATPAGRAALKAARRAGW